MLTRVRAGHLCTRSGDGTTLSLAEYVSVHSVLVGFLRRTTIGVAVIAVGVPLCQNQVLTLAQTREEGPALSVTGDVADLSPGRVGRLVLTVHNDGDVQAVVRRLTTTVRAQAPGCTIVVRPWTGRLDVAAGGAASQAVAVHVSGSRCSAASWTLDYTATA